MAGKDGSNGNLLYALAVKRCDNYGTCSDDGKAVANTHVYEAFVEGQKCVMEGTYDAACATTAFNKIKVWMTVPQVQGLLRYVWKADPVAYLGGGAKEWAEGWAFANAVLPQLDSCNPAVASAVDTNLRIGKDRTPMTDGFVSLKGKIESCYSSIGITCEMIGDLEQAGETWPTCVGDPIITIAGYATVADVTEHAKIDLDVAAMGAAMGAKDADGNLAPNYAAAKAAYTTGGNSFKTVDVARTLKGFSKDMTGERPYDEYAAYYGSTTYADDFVTAALDGTGDFEGVEAVVRKEAAMKGVVYQNVW